MKSTGLPENMQMFNSLTVHIFDVLYEAFPQPAEIDPLKIGSGINIGGVKVDPARAGSIAENTLQWLATEGFIRYRADLAGPASMFGGVQLTLKSLRILDTVPASTDFGEDPDPLIVMIRKSLASGDAEVIKKILKLLFE